jgi:hypothetical protein
MHRALVDYSGRSGPDGGLVQLCSTTLTTTGNPVLISVSATLQDYGGPLNLMTLTRNGENLASNGGFFTYFWSMPAVTWIDTPPAGQTTYAVADADGLPDNPTMMKCLFSIVEMKGTLTSDIPSQ